MKFINCILEIGALVLALDSCGINNHYQTIKGVPISVAENRIRHVGDYLVTTKNYFVTILDVKGKHVLAYANSIAENGVEATALI